jgi:MFS family permease
MQKKSGVFYGWYIVAISCLATSTGIAPFVFLSLGFFMIPFYNEFGWTRGQISSITPVLLFSLMIAQPFAGRFIDKLGTRNLLIPSTLAFGLLLAAIPTFVNEIWHLAIIFFLIGTLGVGANTMPHMRIISGWFNKKRGLAIGISVSGIGLGYTYVPMLLESTISTRGWRAGYYALSLLVLFIAAPLVYIFLKESPEQMGLLADGEESSDTNQVLQSSIGLTSSETIRKLDFWLLLFIFLFISFNLHGLTQHLPSMMVDRGFDSSVAAKIASSLGLSVLVSRILIGYLLDIYFAPRVAMLFFGLSTIGIAMFLLSSSLPFLFLAAILAGLSLGAEIDILAYLIGKYFGLRSFGEIYGLLFVGIFLGTAMGSPAFGLSFDKTGSYTSILTIAIVVNIVAVLLTAKLSPYPEQIDTEARASN